jgi:hypothetical protein
MTLEYCNKHRTVVDAHILARVFKTSHKLFGIIPADRESFLFTEHLLRLHSVGDRYMKYDYGALVE